MQVMSIANIEDDICKIIERKLDPGSGNALNMPVSQGIIKSISKTIVVQFFMQFAGAPSCGAIEPEPSVQRDSIPREITGNEEGFKRQTVALLTGRGIDPKTALGLSDEIFLHLRTAVASTPGVDANLLHSDKLYRSHSFDTFQAEALSRPTKYGNGQCVALVHAAVPELPNYSQWKDGGKINAIDAPPFTAGHRHCHFRKWQISGGARHGPTRRYLSTLWDVGWQTRNMGDRSMEKFGKTPRTIHPIQPFGKKSEQRGGLFCNISLIPTIIFIANTAATDAAPSFSVSECPPLAEHRLLQAEVWADGIMQSGPPDVERKDAGGTISSWTEFENSQHSTHILLCHYTKNINIPLIITGAIIRCDEHLRTLDARKGIYEHLSFRCLSLPTDQGRLESAPPHSTNTSQ